MCMGVSSALPLKLTEGLLARRGEVEVDSNASSRG